MMKLKEVNIKAVESRYKYQREKVVKIILKNENLEIDPEYNGAHLEYTFTCKYVKHHLTQYGIMFSVVKGVLTAIQLIMELLDLKLS